MKIIVLIFIKKGTQHNLVTMEEIIYDVLRSNAIWQGNLIKIFCFDALIGNTDRHQENWGLFISTSEYHDEIPKIYEHRLAPAFDNGTSLGHEIIEANIAKKMSQIDKYINDGRHHLRKDPDSNIQFGHIELIEFLLNKFPGTLEIVQESLQFDEIQIDAILEALFSFNIAIEHIDNKKYVLSRKRIDFIIALTKKRRNILLETIRKCS